MEPQLNRTAVDRDRAHRDDGPAHIERHTTGEVICEYWFKRGQPPLQRRCEI